MFCSRWTNASRITAAVHQRINPPKMGKSLKDGPSFTKRYRCPLVTCAIIVIVGIILSYRNPPSLTPVITIQDGQIQGVVDYSRNGTEFWSFRGIPFARPPIGKLRFAAPIPSEPWKGVKQTTQYSAHCKQFDPMVFHLTDGHLDCLYLNVFAHPIKRNEEASRKVVIYIPGGGFMCGGAKYHFPTFFMDHNIVLVIFNYRLGPFGFLNLESEKGDGSLPRGNMGLKDQLLVLKWVQSNAAHFGGDPNRVTIFGQSAGAISVHAHILSPQSRGLFHRAIAQSGSMFCPWGASRDLRKISANFVRRLGCPLDDREKMMSCLENYDEEEMVKLQVSMMELEGEKDLLVPSVEYFKGDDDVFLGESTLDLVRKGEFAKVPLLMSMTGGEAAFRVARFDALPDDMISKFEANWTELFPKFLGFLDIPPSLSNDIREHYFGNASFTKDPNSFKHKMAQICSQGAVWESIRRAGMIHARSGAPTYMYLFNYTSKLMVGFYSLYRAVGHNDWLHPKLKVPLIMFIDSFNEHILGNPGSREYGITHGDDLFQQWNVNGESALATFGDLDFSQGFIQMIIDFVNGTQPFTYRGTEFLPINISAVDNGERIQYMLLDNSEGKGKMIPEPFSDAMEYWREIGIENFQY